VKRRAGRNLVLLGLSLGTLLLGGALSGTRATVTTVATVSIYGDITAQDVAAFERMVANSPIQTVQLDGISGDPYAAMAIGRIIRKNQIQVKTVFSEKCSGSCALIYIAGVARWNFGTIGLHRPYLADRSLTTDQLSGAFPTMLSAVRAYVTEMGVSAEFANIMMSTDPQDARTYDYNGIEQLVPSWDPAYEHALSDSSARQYGISNDEYQRRLNDSHSRGSDKIPGHDDCVAAIMWHMSVKTYQLRDKRAKEVCAPEFEERSSLATTGLILTRGFYDLPAVLNAETCYRKVVLGN
jgi:hypothetical protein